jgi:nitroimidazol reductase NimA-like FMN-containing flavoprotein (pyridoxamine 5'-phosphate oxidase superfamily)
MGTKDPERDVEYLGRAECWALLESTVVGRLAVILDGVPVIFPVNHVTEWDAVIVRCDPGGKLAGLYEGAPVSYEIDDLDADGRGGWSVQAKGRAHPMHDPWDREAAPDPERHGRHFDRAAPATNYPQRGTQHRRGLLAPLSGR